MARIDAFFKLMNEQGASDLHLIAGQQPILRVNGDLERVKFKEFENDDLKAMLYDICPENTIKVFEENNKIPMPDQPFLSTSQIDNILNYIEQTTANQRLIVKNRNMNREARALSVDQKPSSFAASFPISAFGKYFLLAGFGFVLLASTYLLVVLSSVVRFS